MLLTTPPVLTPFAAALLFASSAVAYAQNRHGSDERGSGDVEARARELDDPAREAWQRPQAVLRALRLAPNATVAEIGSATGYFAARIARALPRGRVIGIDVEPAMVRYLERRAQRERLANLRAQLGTPQDPRLGRPVDLALLVDTYPYIRHREHYFARLRAALKPGGRLALIDFRHDAPLGPPLHERVPPQLVMAELARAGFRLRQRHYFLPWQHFLVLHA